MWVIKREMVEVPGKETVGLVGRPWRPSTGYAQAHSRGSRVQHHTSMEVQNSQGKKVVVLCKHREARETGKGDHLEAGESRIRCCMNTGMTGKAGYSAMQV